MKNKYISSVIALLSLGLFQCLILAQTTVFTPETKQDLIDKLNTGYYTANSPATCKDINS